MEMVLESPEPGFSRVVVLPVPQGLGWLGTEEARKPELSSKGDALHSGPLLLILTSAVMS